MSTQKSSKVASAPKNDTSGSTMSPQKGSKEIGRLDASDVRSLEEAKDEIRRLRRIASEAFAKNDDLEKRLSTVASSSNLTGTGTSRRNKKEARAAVMARGSDRDYVKKSIPKSDQVQTTRSRKICCSEHAPRKSCKTSLMHLTRPISRVMTL